MLVVFYHSILFWNGAWFTENPVETSAVLSILAAWLNSFHIYGFTLVSGYLFSYLKLENGKYSEFGAFVKNKVQRLVLPYAFIALVWVIPVQCLFFENDLKTICYKYVLATSPSQLWFLVMLFDVFLIFWLLSDFFAKHDFWGTLLAGGFYGVGIIGSMVVPNIFMIWTACQYIPLFWLGFKLRQRGTYLIRKIPVCVWIVADLILFAFVQYLGNTELLLLKIVKLGANFVLHIVGALMAFVVLQKIADRTNWNNALFSFLSKRSMVIYLVHQQVIYFFIHWLNGRVGIGLNVVVNFVGAMGISLAVATVLLKFRITRFLLGEKQ